MGVESFFNPHVVFIPYLTICLSPVYQTGVDLPVLMNGNAISAEPKSMLGHFAYILLNNIFVYSFFSPNSSHILPHLPTQVTSCSFLLLKESGVQFVFANYS